MFDVTGIPMLPGYIPTMPGQMGNRRPRATTMEMQKGFPMTSDSPAKPQDSRASSRLNNPAQSVAASMMFPNATRVPAPEPFKPQFVQMDGKCLSFKAFLKEDMPEAPEEGYRVRRFNIFYFLVDHTMRISEDRQENSGLPQGGFLKRSRVPRLSPGTSVGVGAAGPTSSATGTQYVTWDQIRLGEPLLVYGRPLTIVDCDQYTRQFFADKGQPQPEGNLLHMIPKDPYFQRRKAAEEKISLKVPDDRRERFINFNRKVLRFYCQWDDRAAIYGERRPYILHLYLEDDTVEICEVKLPNDGRDGFSKLLRRQKLPKDNQGLQDIGSNPTQFYTDADLRVGERISVFGRPFLIYDCDQFTRQHLAQKFGLHDVPDLTERIRTPFVPAPAREVPPPIGIGSDEDSLASMASLIPRPPRRDEAKLMTYAGKALRFLGQLANPASPEDVDRKFIIGFWLADDSISIFEPPQQNSGIVGGKFLERMVRNNPETGKRFTFKDFVVGGTIKVNCYEFKLVDVDAFSKKFIDTGGTTLRSSLYKSSPLDIMQNLQKRYEEAKEALRAAFHVMDEDRSGNITHSEFIQSLELLHYDIEEEDAEPLLIWFDPDWKGYISYADFCDAIIRAAKFPAFLKQYALEKSTNRNQPAPASQVLNTDAP